MRTKMKIHAYVRIIVGVIIINTLGSYLKSKIVREDKAMLLDQISIATAAHILLGTAATLCALQAVILLIGSYGLREKWGMKIWIYANAMAILGLASFISADLAGSIAVNEFLFGVPLRIPSELFNILSSLVLGALLMFFWRLEKSASINND